MAFTRKSDCATTGSKKEKKRAGSSRIRSRAWRPLSILCCLAMVLISAQRPESRLAIMVAEILCKKREISELVCQGACHRPRRTTLRVAAATAKPLHDPDTSSVDKSWAWW
jgi:hypothetical protein